MSCLVFMYPLLKIRKLLSNVECDNSLSNRVDVTSAVGGDERKGILRKEKNIKYVVEQNK